MRLTNPANFEVYYCDERGSLQRPGGMTADEVTDWRQSANRSWTKARRQDVAFMRPFIREKPAWFLSAERSARRFVKNLGLEACRGTQITLLDVTDPKALKEIFPYDGETTSTDAQNSYYYGIIARYDRAQLAYDHMGKLAIGHLLVHELTHAAEWQSPTVLTIFDSEEDRWLQLNRQGQMLHQDEMLYGQFYSEGWAEFNAGLYSRQQDMPGSPLVSITDNPSMELPDHYAAHRPDKGVPYVVGPDGYSMELLAWGVQERGISSTDAFVASAHATYSLDPTTRLGGLRQFASYVNAVRPGLYQDLRNLQYGHEAWQTGLGMVHDAVTT